MTGPSIEQRIDLERIRVFFGHARGNMAGMLLGAVVLGGLLSFSGVSTSTVAIWGALFSVACLAVLAFERRVQRIGITARNCRRLMHIRVGLGTVVALFYGVVGLLLPDAPTRLEDLLLFVVLSTVITLGALSFAVMPLHYLAINFSCLLPTMAHYTHRHVSQGDNFYLMMLAVVALWQAAVVLKTRKVSATAIDAITLTQRLHDEIEEHKRTKEAMRAMALQDALTGLGNRRHFDEVLTRTLGNARREGSHFGVLAIDLDKFKPVNDQHGHAVGDDLLLSVARRMQGAVRVGDFCARLGGDEFAILLCGLAGESATITVADKIRARLALPHTLGSIVVSCHASVGWATYPEDGQDAIRLLATADARMYQQKQLATAAARKETAPA